MILDSWGMNILREIKKVWDSVRARAHLCTMSSHWGRLGGVGTLSFHMQIQPPSIHPSYLIESDAVRMASITDHCEYIASVWWATQTDYTHDRNRIHTIFCTNKSTRTESLLYCLGTSFVCYQFQFLGVGVIYCRNYAWGLFHMSCVKNQDNPRGAAIHYVGDVLNINSVVILGSRRSPRRLSASR